MMTAGITPLMPAMPVFMMSVNGIPWMRMMTPETTADSRNASIVRADEVTTNDPTAIAITISTGSKKFQNRLVRTPG